QRDAGGVRTDARAGHAHHRAWFYGAWGWGGHGGPAADRRDDDLQLCAPGARSDRERRGQDALHVGRAIPRPPGDSWSGRLGAPTWRTTFAGAGIVVLPRSGIKGGHALDT